MDKRSSKEQSIWDSTQITARCVDCGKHRASSYRNDHDEPVYEPQDGWPVCGFCARRLYSARLRRNAQ